MVMILTVETSSLSAPGSGIGRAYVLYLGSQNAKGEITKTSKTDRMDPNHILILAR